MANDDDGGILSLYVERGARRYEAFIPRPVVDYFAEGLRISLPCEDGRAFLDTLRPPGSPPRPPPPARAPAAEPPLLNEEHERMMDELGFSAEQKREVRGAPVTEMIEHGLAGGTEDIERVDALFDEEVADLVLDAAADAAILSNWLSLPAGPEREANDRSLTRWVDMAFAIFFANVMAALAEPGDLADRRLLFGAVRAFRGACQRLAPGDRALFTAYHRDGRGFVELAAVRGVTIEEERLRYEGLLERLDAALTGEAPEAQAPITLAEGQQALAWLAEWVGKADKRAASCS